MDEGKAEAIAMVKETRRLALRLHSLGVPYLDEAATLYRIAEYIERVMRGAFGRRPSAAVMPEDHMFVREALSHHSHYEARIRRELEVLRDIWDGLHGKTICEKWV